MSSAREGPKILGCGSVFYPDSEDIMGWDISENGFKIVLSPRLPELIRQNLAGDVDAFLGKYNLRRADIGNWVIHTGGPKVLEAIQDTLGAARSRSGAIVGLPEAIWEPFLRLGSPRAGGCSDEPSTGTRDIWRDVGHGAGLLLGNDFGAMVNVSMPPAETDVFIVGGGPAGLAAALAARRSGLDVVVADRAQPPIDKACGEGLMPDGVAALRQIGVTLGLEHGFPFRGIRFLDDELEAEASFPNSFGLGIRRTLLHRILTERAQDAGIVTCWNTRIEASILQG